MYEDLIALINEGRWAVQLATDECPYHPASEEARWWNHGRQQGEGERAKAMGYYAWEDDRLPPKDNPFVAGGSCHRWWAMGWAKAYSDRARWEEHEWDEVAWGLQQEEAAC